MGLAVKGLIPAKNFFQTVGSSAEVKQGSVQSAKIIMEMHAAVTHTEWMDQMMNVLEQILVVVCIAVLTPVVRIYSA